MPVVTAPPRGNSNGEEVTEFLDTVSTVPITYNFPTTQEKLKITNNGYGSLQATVNGAAVTILPTESKEFYGSVDSFFVVASGGVQSFEAVASNYKDEEELQLTGSNGKFDYEVLNYTVLALNGSVLYAASLDGKNLHKSQDNGKTWSGVLWIAPSGTITVAHLTVNGALILFTTDGNVYRSTNDSTFTSVLTGIKPPLLTHGVDSAGNTICFGEYTVTDGIPVRIFRSTDGGVNWVSSIDVGPSGSGIRHFHSCQYISNHGMWIATTGDGAMNWYKSFDGITWTLMFTSTEQRRRTLSVLSRKRGEFIWSSDGGTGYGGVFKSSLTNLNEMDSQDIERLVTIQSSYGIAGEEQVILTSTVTGTDPNRQMAYIYASLDGGRNWFLEKEYPIALNSGYGGFVQGMLGPDNKGNYYMPITDPAGMANRSTIKAVSRLDAVKSPLSEAGIHVLGARKKIVSQTFTVTNAPKAAATPFVYKPAIGCIETIVQITASISGPTGATTGTHQIEVTYGASGPPGRLFTVSAPFNGQLQLTPLGISTPTTFLEGTFDIYRRMMDGKTIQLMRDTPMFINYKNMTDVDRADTVSLTIVVHREAVYPEF